MAKKKQTESDKNPSKQKRTKKPISNHEKLIMATESFINELKCSREMFEVIVPILIKIDKNRDKKIDDTLEYLKSLKKGKARKIKEIERTKLILGIKEMMSTAQKMHTADILFRRNSIVLLIALYDEFLSDVLKVVYKAYPDRLKGPDRTLSYEEIFKFKSFDRVLDKFILNEIDRVLRLSHYEQLEYLDERFKLGLMEYFLRWKNFIEIAERRNLFVHTGGSVSQQYLDVCRKHDIKLDPKIKEGSYVDVIEEYFESSYRCLFELGVRIGQSIVRRLFPNELEDADRSLTAEIGVLLEEEGQWELGRIIFDFALNIPRKLITNDESHKIHVINLCICLKHLNKKKEMLKLLKSIDWSSSSKKFVLAVAVLKENYKEAEALMSIMNGKDPIDEGAFRTWPLFLDFRKTNYFTRSFKKIYKRDYEPIIFDKKLIDAVEKKKQKTLITS